MNDYTPIFRSPITTPELELSPDSHLTLSDLTGAAVTLIQGKAGEGLQAQFDRVPQQPGEVVDLGEGLLACLTPTQFYLFGKSPAADLPPAATLENRLDGAAATDLTHGQAVLRLAGAPAAEVLSKICGLNFHEAAFPNLHAAQTSAAKIKTLIVRADEGDRPAYFLHVDRPLGQYFWETVWDAGQEFGIAVSP
ncbi:MAG: sarcosine oxidase subunit gamma family protein [Chloroflexota bacterium]